MEVAVDDHDRSDRAAAEAGHGFEGELAVGRCFARTDAELPLEFLQDLGPAPDVAGRSRAHRHDVAAARLQAEAEALAKATEAATPS